MNATTNPLAALLALFGIDLDEVRPAMRRFRSKRRRDPLRYQRHTARRDDRRPMTPGLVKRWRLAMLAVAKDLARRKAGERAARPLTRARRKKLEARWMNFRFLAGRLMAGKFWAFNGVENPHARPITAEDVVRACRGLRFDSCLDVLPTR